MYGGIIALMSKKKAAPQSEASLLANLIRPHTRQVILDTETTGLNASSGDRLVEIGAVEVIERKLTGRRFHVYLNPQRDMPAEAQAVHGLSSSFLKDKPLFKSVAKDFLEFIKDSELVIHNAPFDVGFLNWHLQQESLGRLDQYVHSVTDTLAIAKSVWQGKRNSLDAICDRLGVDRSGRVLHGALLDAEILADVYIEMSKGQNDLMLIGGAGQDSGQSDGEGQKIDLRSYNLPILKANEDELKAHAEYISGMEKATKELSVWSIAERQLDPAFKYNLDGTKAGSDNESASPPPQPASKTTTAQAAAAKPRSNDFPEDTPPPRKPVADFNM